MTFTNSEIFKGSHSAIYEALYKDKSHSKMALEIASLIPKPLAEKRILEIGCGTGNFTTEISQNYKKGVLAIDSSSDMLELAKRKHYASKIEFLHTDVLSLSISETFSLIGLLFHVVSYLITKKEIDALISIFKKNTRENDYVIFDFWNCKCVHANNPIETKTIIELDEKSTLIRTVVPELSKNPHIWPLQIRLETVDLNNVITNKIEERHSMRCFSTEFWVRSLQPEFTLLREWDIDSGKTYSGDKYGSLLVFERTSELGVK